MTARPAAITWFQRLYALGIVLSIVDIFAAARQMDQAGDDETMILAIGLGVVALIIAAIYLFWYYIMRRRSNVARWLLMVFTILAVPLAFVDTEQRVFDVWRGLEFFNLGLSFVTVACLFLPGAKRWFDGTPENLAETFS